MPRRTNIADSGQVSDLLHFDGGREIAINVMPMRSRYLGLLPATSEIIRVALRRILHVA